MARVVTAICRGDTLGLQTEQRLNRIFLMGKGEFHCPASLVEFCSPMSGKNRGVWGLVLDFKAVESRCNLGGLPTASFG